MKFIMIYGPPGIGKESVGRELAKRNGWNLFQQHLAFDISCAVIGFGNDGFEKHQRAICLDAFRAIFNKGSNGIVFTFCYVHPASNYFIEGLLDLLKELKVEADFVRLSCDLKEHILRVTSDGRKKTNKIQSQKHLEEYLERFNFSVDIAEVKTFKLDSTNLSPIKAADKIETQIFA